jgi:hypothetical protein
MSRDGILLAAVLGVLALGMLYAVMGSRVSDQWRAWITRAFVAAGGAFGVGMLLLGLPGAVLVEAVTGPGSGRELAPDSAWPLSVLVTQVGALLIVPASMVLRLVMPTTAGWGHAVATALLTIAATFVFTLLVT